MSLERNDIGAASNDPWLIAMQKAVDPLAMARNDYDVFADLANALGVGAAFTEGRSAEEWLPHLYETWRENVAATNADLPPFDEFWRRGYLPLPDIDEGLVLFEDLRRDPIANPPRTPSGRLELFSETIAGFVYDDCAGHPTWYEPREWRGSPDAETFPLVLIANNPRTRLHSQLDEGAYSQSVKIQGWEPVRIHLDDAAVRSIGDGDIVRLFNGRGSCLAGAVLSRDVRPGVVQLSTGAWYDPIDPDDPRSMCAHGNPNVLTFDQGTSKLAQGCSGQQALVDVALWEGPAPPIRAYAPPATVARDLVSEPMLTGAG